MTNSKKVQFHAKSANAVVQTVVSLCCEKHVTKWLAGYNRVKDTWVTTRLHTPQVITGASRGEEAG